jgi:mycofactocin precursor
MADPTVELVDDTTATDAVDAEDVLVEDVLVEEVSIDGMCGVY